MSHDEIWDREMTMEEFKSLDPSLQRKRIDTSLMRKVTEVQRWAARGVPKSVDWRERSGSRTKLREWHDPKKKLWRWSDDTPDHPEGRNKGLIAKWKKARTQLASGTAAKPRNELETWKNRALALEMQNTILIAEKAGLEDRLVRSEAKLRQFGTREARGNDLHPN
ncbi:MULTISPECIES: hypothetical protein [Rhizobium]|uniref:hypothetical protein n=1 Tax=Rhizobium TaxID=379 RepID=UPI0007EA35E2|nr:MULTISPECIES: hypothetical protein [Rhizobium]ANL04638.1 hypothetical protein AMJ99_CH03116 [Rhizobium esperanzae]ANM35483.1 hypothetical protein AMK04_CH03120 [Rhizobium sp. N871]